MGEGCKRQLVELTHRGRFFQCPRCSILYQKHRDAGIEPVWVTKANESLPISQIPMSHLQHIVGLLLLRTDWREHYRKVMIDELELRMEEEQADEQST